MFTKFVIDNETNLFEELSKSTNFDNVTNGRKGANIVDYKNNLIPLVRTTSNYDKPVQKFLPIHYNIIKMIKRVSKIENLELNNALIEIYDNQYRTMGFHSDQALDLAENSYICIFSCYDNFNNSFNLRKLKIKEKETNKCFEILMEHNSIIIFSTETNKKHLHRIVLETNRSNNKWLGITFRLSKTFIQFVNEIPYLYGTDKILRIANEEEKKQFRKYKGIENAQIGYDYPEIDYTISVGDMLQMD